MATEKQTQKLAGRLTEHLHLFRKLSTGDAQWAINNPKGAIEVAVTAVANRSKEAVKQILEFVDTTHSTGAKEFKAREKFREGKETDGVKIASLDEGFKEHFLGLVELDVKDTPTRIHCLCKDSRNIQIIIKLGGEDAATSTLTHLWSDLKKQGHGEGGPLFTNGLINTRYIRDDNGILRAVRVYWNYIRGGWCVEVYSIGSILSVCSAGGQVFSHDPAA